MRITGIGINMHPMRINGDMEKFKEELIFFEELGYDYVEIPVDAVDVIFEGKLREDRMLKIQKILGFRDLKYTVHAPNALDLRDMDNHDTQFELFKSCLDFTARIGADIFVYHYGRKSKNMNLEEKLYENILRISDYANKLGITICVENIEIDPVNNVIDFVKKVNRENVAMTLDIGHAYLSANYFGFDFLDSVKKASPFVKHIHVHDNFGRFEEMRLKGYDQYKWIPYRRLVALGRGDLHLPPGWGKVPFDDVCEILKDYEGVFMLEYHHYRYRMEADEILEQAREYVKRHGGFVDLRNGTHRSRSSSFYKD